ncbi:hypothetical protein D623_10004887 [Myotis brandtii]|uniref:Uncharacterized protein n=1 Tax=Myotis brandtii TaxID=109478 RepID=S7NCI0_MYOBR|nr:hypothetical protein D623_10004887 [Myotis brandtii]
MGPNRESNPQPFGARDSAATNRATRPGRNESIIHFSQMQLLCCPAPPACPQASLFSVWRKLLDQLSGDPCVPTQTPETPRVRATAAGAPRVARTTRLRGSRGCSGLRWEAGWWPDSRSNEPSEKEPWTALPAGARGRLPAADTVASLAEGYSVTSSPEAFSE